MPDFTPPGELAIERRDAIGVAALGSLAIPILTGAGESVFVGGLILVAAVVVCTLRPGAGIACVVLALPGTYHLQHLAGARFSVLELAIVATVMGYGIRLLGQRPSRLLRSVRTTTSPLDITAPAALIVVAAIVSILQMEDLGHRAEAWREVRLVIVEPVAVLFVALGLLRDRSVRALVVVAIVVAGSATAVGTLLSALERVSVVGTGDLTRAAGSFPHPNNLAFFLERTTMMSLALLAASPRSAILWGFSIAQALALGLTLSRGALFAVAVAIVVVFLLRGEQRRARLAGAILGAGILLAAFGLRDRFLDTGGSGSEPTRLAIWRSSLRMLRDHPFAGVGPDQFLYHYGRRYIEPAAWTERYTSHPHNIVLDVWLRLGVIGLAAFATLAVGIGAAGRRWWSAGRQDAVVIGGTAAIVSGLVHGLVDNGFFLPDLAVMTWLFVALIATSSYATTRVGP